MKIKCYDWNLYMKPFKLHTVGGVDIVWVFFFCFLKHCFELISKIKFFDNKIMMYNIFLLLIHFTVQSITVLKKCHTGGFQKCHVLSNSDIWVRLGQDTRLIASNQALIINNFKLCNINRDR
jgi:hypothetical protein